MDTLLHGLIALAIVIIIGWSGFRLLKPIPLLIIIGAMLPDMDYFFNFFDVPIWLQHRGISHSFLTVILYVIPCALILSIPFIQKTLWNTKEKVHTVFMAVTFGAYVHLISDVILPAEAMFAFPLSLEHVKLLNYEMWYALLAINIIVVGIILLGRKQVYEDFESYTMFAYILGIIITAVFTGILCWWAIQKNLSFCAEAKLNISILYINILSSFAVIETFLIKKIHKLSMYKKVRIHVRNI